jgi:hypothetical protein
MILDPLFLGKTQHRRPQMDRFHACAGWFFHAFLALVTLGVAVLFVLF